MADRFKNGILDTPFHQAAVAVPVSNNALAYTTKALYVGTGGNVVVRMAGYNISNSSNLDQVALLGNNDVTFFNVANGTTLNIRVTNIFTTSTANNMVALF